MDNQERILKAIQNKCKFRYKSYDHKAAIRDYNEMPAYAEVRSRSKAPDCFDMPAELKTKHETWKIGKLRTITFFPDGDINRMSIGNRYSKNFYLDGLDVDFFITDEAK